MVIANRMMISMVICAYVYIYMHIYLHNGEKESVYYKELPHVIMEADKCQGLPLVNGTSRRADGVILVQRPAGSGLRKSQCFSLSPKAGKRQMSQLEGSEVEGFLSFSALSCSGLPVIG